jgi:hemerythrin superfamily protein
MAGKKGSKRSGSQREATTVADKASGVAARATAAVVEAVGMGKLAIQGKTGNLDAVEMLTTQHHDAESHLEKALKATDAESRRQLIIRVCNNVQCHMRIEEELFYPLMASLEPFDAKDKKRQEDEHDDVKDLIKKLLAADDVLSDKVTNMLQDLEKNLKEHHGREEHDIFPKVKSVTSESERTDLGEKLRQRFSELHGDQEPAAIVDKGLKQG